MNKVSKYNIFTGDFVYNLISKKFLQLSESLIDYLKTNAIIDKEFPTDILSVLKSNNIIVDYEELQYIDFKYNSLKFDNEKSSYIVYPTLLCNFSCDYCFETVKQGTFSERETKILKQFFKNETKRLNEINIRWSGGEPLLVWDKIKDISSVFNTYKGSYSASIATNGYLLNEKIVSEMKLLNFNSITITVDGSKEEHNRKRYTNTDKNTYDKIINGISIAAKDLKTRIRFNIDMNNRDIFVGFLKDLDKHLLNKQNIEIYVKPIISKQGCSISDNLIDEESFFYIELEYFLLAKEYNFKYSLHPNFKSDIRCIYHHINSYAIDPKLNLYKCAEYIGVKKHQIGKIDEKAKINKTGFGIKNTNLMYSPISISECRNCKVLPICNGKCPIEWEKNNCKEHSGCIPEKKSIEYKINEMIKYEI